MGFGVALKAFFGFVVKKKARLVFGQQVFFNNYVRDAACEVCQFYLRKKQLN